MKFGLTVSKLSHQLFEPFQRTDINVVQMCSYQFAKEDKGGSVEGIPHWGPRAWG